MISNRDLWKANVSADLAVIDNVTFTPLVKYVEAKYDVATGQQGLQDSRKWSTGADLVYVLNPATSFMVGYMYEWGSQLLFGIDCTENSTAGAQCTPGTLPGVTQTNDTTTVHTVTAAVRYAAIPEQA